MLRLLKLVVIAAIGVAIILAAIFALNYFNTGIKIKQNRTLELPAPTNSISVLNWNLGYAGLGKESDFYMDGGDMFTAPSKGTVLRNVDGIQNILNNNKSDFHIFQEISEPDILTMGVNVLAGVTEAMQAYHSFYSSDFRTKLIPTKWALRHGMATFAGVKAEPVEIIDLPLEPTKLAGVIQRLYHVEKTGLKTPDGKDWVLLNIHLSAFDEGGNVRLKQLDRVIEIAAEFYKDGKHVIVGGDWNIQLSDAEFPNTTAEKFLFWRTKFPHEKLKPGWQIVVDETVPTMRSNERPYQKGENFTSIIDGYMVSPNVEIISVETIVTNFEYTDHQPVKAVFTAKTE